MKWKVYEDDLIWPADLSAAQLKKLDKKKQCEHLIDILTTGEKEFGRLVAKREIPPKKANKAKIARWVKGANAFCNGAELKSVNATLSMAQDEAKKLLLGDPLDKKVPPFLI